MEAIGVIGQRVLAGVGLVAVDLAGGDAGPTTVISPPTMTCRPSDLTAKGRATGQVRYTRGNIRYVVPIVDREVLEMYRVAVDEATRNDIAAATAAHHELGRDYDDAVAESLVDRIGAEIDKRIDARLRTGSSGSRPPGTVPAAR